MKFQSEEEKKFYEQAIKDITVFTEDVIEQCRETASYYNYDEEWVYETFAKIFHKLKKLEN